MRITPMLGLCLLVGCAGGKTPDGVWLLQLDDFVADEETPVAITFNYLDAEVIDLDDDGPDWAETSTNDASPSAWFVEVFDVEDVDGDYVKLFVWDDTVRTGVKQEDGSWTFTWTDTLDLTEGEAHTSGYAYTEHTTAQTTTAFNVVIADSTATGTLRYDYTATSTWDESDVWDEVETGLSEGQTPLDILQHTSDGSDVVNTFDGVECSGTPCNLTYVWVEGGSRPVSMRRTDLSHDEFESIEDATQGGGLPNDIPVGEGR